MKAVVFAYNNIGCEGIEALLKNLTEQVAKREEAQEQSPLQHDIFGYNVFTVYCGRDVAA